MPEDSSSYDRGRAGEDHRGCRLAQNFGALKALATVGIQHGHMALHAHNVALAVGASGPEVERLAAILVDRRQVRQDVAEAELARMRGLF